MGHADYIFSVYSSVLREVSGDRRCAPSHLFKVMKQLANDNHTQVLARAALIAAIYRRSLVLSGKARTVITNAKLVNHIGTDVSRIDFCAGFFHVSLVF